MKQDYVYIINYPKEEKELFEMEMNLFFNEWKYPYFISSEEIEKDRSLYIKYQLKIEYMDSSLDQLVNKMWNDQYSKEDYRVYYLDITGLKTHYGDRIEAMKKVGSHIVGEFNLKNPKSKIGVVNIDGIYYVGSVVVGDPNWDRYLNKPHSYSQSLPIRVSKSLVNIASGKHKQYSVIDGCCGVGTVVLEGLFMECQMIGNEINPHIANHAKENLTYYGYDSSNIIKGDFLDINTNYDSTILDIPYGIVSQISDEEVISLLKKAYSISNTLVLIITNSMSEQLKDIGYQYIETICVYKHNFKRYIHVARRYI